MRYSSTLTVRICLFLVVIALIPVSAAAAGLAANPSSVVLQFKGWTPITQTFRVTDAGGASVAFTATLNDTNVPGIFTVVTSGDTVTVTVLVSLTTKPAGVYHATVTVRSGDAVLTVPVSLLVGNVGQIAVDKATLSFSAAVGALTVPPQTLVVTAGDAGLGFTASATTQSGGPWLSVSGTTATTPATLTVTVSAGGLPAGTYAGNIKITNTSIGAETNVPVSFAVGSTGVFSISQPALTFLTGGALLPDPQQVDVSAGSAAQFYALATTDWLRINGTSANITPRAFNAPATLNIGVVPTGLASGYHTGKINLWTADGLSNAAIDVTLGIDVATGAVLVTPGNLTFAGAAGVVPDAKQVTAYTSTAGVTWVASIPSAFPWLTITPGSGALIANTSNRLTVSVSPGLTTAAANLGYIDLTFYGSGSSVLATSRITVSYTVGGGGTGGAVAVSPAQLTFAAQAGSATAPASQEIAVTGATGTAFSASVSTSSGGNWLSVSPTTGQATSGVIVSINNAIASTLAAGTYQGAVTVVSGTGTSSVGVTLNVLGSPVLQVTMGARALYYDPAAGTAPPTLYFYPVSSDGQPLAYTAATSTPWIQLHEASNTAPNGFAATISPGSLPAGISEGAIVVSAAGAANSPITIPITVVVAGASGVLVNPTSLSFQTAVGNSPASKTLTVNTASYYTVTASSTGNWLSVSPESGWSSGTLTVTVNSAALAASTYTGTITVNAGGVTQVVNVTLTVGSGTVATLTLENVSPAFDYEKGGALPAAKTLAVGSTGGQIGITATAASAGNWLAVTPAAGNTPATLTVSLNQQNLQNLAPGSYTGSITVAGGGASISRTVTLLVRQAAALSLSPATLAFSYRTDGAVPGAQTVTVNSTGTALPYSAASDAPWLQASPATGATPGSLSVSVNPVGLAPGQYRGRIAVAPTAGGAAIPASLDVTLTVAAPLPTITAVTNSASFLEGPIAPGEMITLFGIAIGPPDLTTLKLDGTGRVATTLAGVRVLVNGVPAPMIYVTAGQVSAVVPYSAAGRLTATVWLEYGGARSNAMTLNCGPVRPAVFTADASGSGPGAILNQDYSRNTPARAAARGSVVTLYVTGEGQTLPGGVDGRVNDNPENLPRPALDVTATVGNRQAKVHYAGAAPGMVAGVMQVNVEIPADAAAGVVPVVVSVGGVSSQPGVTVAVQ